MQCSGVIGEAETTAVKRSAGRCVCTYTALHVLLHELHDVGAPHTRLLTHEPHYAGAPHACLLMHCFNHTMLELHPRCVCVCVRVCMHIRSVGQNRIYTVYDRIFAEGAN